MDYTKIDEQNIKETKSVETSYNINTLKREIELLDANIVRADKRKAELVAKKAEYEALVTEATKLGVVEKAKDVEQSIDSK